MANRHALGNLHTGSIWLTGKQNNGYSFTVQKEELTKLRLLKERKEILAAKEQRFYAQYGVNITGDARKDFEAFMIKVRQEANTEQRDGQSAGKILARFCNVDPNFIDSNYEYVHVEGQPNPTLQGKVSAYISQIKQERHFSGLDLNLDIVVNTKVKSKKGDKFFNIDLNELVREAFLLDPKELKNAFNTRLNKGKLDEITRVEDIFEIVNDVLKNNDVYVNGQSFGVEEYETYITVFSRAYPFLNQKQREEVLTLNLGKLVEDDLKEIDKKVQYFFTDILGAGSEKIKLRNGSTLRQAILTVYQNCISPTFEFGGTKFLGDGKNFFNNLKGAIGEFATGLWALFISTQLSNKTEKTIAFTGGKIDKKHSNEKMKKDISITHKGTETGKMFKENFGIQVKNWNVTNALKGKYQEIGSTVYGDTIAHYLNFGQQEQEEFITLIANAAFNTDFRSYFKDNYQKDLITAIQYGIDGLFNLATIDSLKDVNTFYLIGGLFLIPGSLILDAAIERSEGGKRAFQSDISVAYHSGGKSDKVFQKELEKEEKTDPNLVNWWWERNTERTNNIDYSKDRTGGSFLRKAESSWKGPGAKNTNDELIRWAGKMTFKSGFDYTYFVNDLLKNEYRIF